MRRILIIGIVITTCLALCDAVWPRNAENVKVPTESLKPAVIAEIKANPEKTPPVIFSADIPVSESADVAEPKLEETEHRAPSKTEEVTSTEKKYKHPNQPRKASLKQHHLHPPSRTWEILE